MKTYQLYFTVDKQTTANNFVFRTTVVSPSGGAYVLEKFETVSGDYTYSFTPTVSGIHSLHFGGDSDSSPYVQDNIFYIDNVLVKDTTLEVPSYTDYYPFGMPMPHRIDGVDSYRYAYQGQEKDPETGKEAFQLRLWDGRIGRWLTTDPKGQYASPYLGMGNNPISRIDPDGETDEENEDWFYNSITGEVYFNESYVKGNESLLGDNWEHLGENGMFGVADYTLLSDIGDFEAITGYLNSSVALSFMKEQGYNFNPVQVTIYRKYKHLINIPILDGTALIERVQVRVTERLKYMKKDYAVTGSVYLINNQYLDKSHKEFFESIGRYHIGYINQEHLKEKPSLYKPLLFIERVELDNWNSCYYGDNNLIKDYINLYGKL